MGDVQPWGIVIWGIAGLVLGAVMRRVSHAPAPPAALEGFTAALFASLMWKVGPAPHLLAYSALAAASVPLAAIDLAENRIPNQLIFPAYPTVLGILSVTAVVEDDSAALVRSILASATLLAAFGLPSLFRPDWIAGGDVKLAGLIGLTTGWASWNAVLTTTVLCWVFALIGWVVPQLTRNAFRRASPTIRTGVPLGPFLISGAFTALLLLSPN